MIRTSKKYNNHVGEHERYMQYTDYSFGVMTLLAFVPHNMSPFSLKKPVASFHRLFHNLLAGMVFLMLPTLIVTFQIAIMEDLPFMGITGLIIIGLTMTTTLLSVIRLGITGVAEILFINGISIWSIFVTILTVLK